MGILLPLLFVWLVNQFERPLQFAGLHAGIAALLALLTGATPTDALLGGIVVLVYFGLLYGLLVRYADTVATWLGILIGGLLLWFAGPLLLA